MLETRLMSYKALFCISVFFVLLMTKQWLHISVLSVVLNASVMLVENHFHMSNHDSCWQRLMILVGGACSLLRRHENITQYIYQKSDNLQYNTLGCWVDGRIVSSTKRLMFQIFFVFFITFCKILCKNPFNLFFNFL